MEDNPEIRTSLSVRDKVVRPRIEEEMSSLLGTIVDIAIYGSASYQGRQSDVYRSIKTLAQMTERLKMYRFTMSKIGLHLRLLPKRSSSLEGQRHVSTVPVKLIKVKNDKHI